MPRPAPARQRTAPAAAPADNAGSLRFTPKNLAFLGGGLASIILGYALLGAADNVFAPLLLVLGYAILIPLGIIL